jgi:hypothetical protein
MSVIYFLFAAVLFFFAFGAAESRRDEPAHTSSIIAFCVGGCVALVLAGVAKKNA